MRTMQDEVVEHAEWLWSKSVVLPDTFGLRPVLGWEHLPSAWLPQKKNFLDARAAEAYLRAFSGNTSAMFSLGRVYASLNPGKLHALAKDDVIVAVAAALTQGSAWVIELAKGPRSVPGKTDPAVFAPLNPALKTNIDFAYIAGLEGDQWLSGYVPFKNDGIVAGRSGMTIASGFDIGQWSKDEIKGKGRIQGMDLPQAVLDQILPYAQRDFRRKTKAQVITEIGTTGPPPTFEGNKRYADLCDAAAFRVWLGRAAALWNANTTKGVPNYVQLPGGWQTVWLSRRYQAQEGSFEDLAPSGKWEEAIVALRKEPLYKSRTKSEADLLEAELPPPVKAPPPKGKE